MFHLAVNCKKHTQCGITVTLHTHTQIFYDEYFYDIYLLYNTFGMDFALQLTTYTQYILQIYEYFYFPKIVCQPTRTHEC